MRVVVKKKQDTFVLGGRRYKKHKIETSPLLQDWADSKYFTLECRRDHGDLDFSEELFAFVQSGLDWLMPFYEYFLTLPEREELL